MGDIETFRRKWVLQAVAEDEAWVQQNRPAVALVATDFYAFNVLSRGQLEFLAGEGLELSLLAGGAAQDEDVLRRRGVGHVVRLPIRRRPNALTDLHTLFVLLRFFIENRFETVVCSTPKAMLLGSLAAWLTRQPRRIALVRGRAYENTTGLKRQVYLLFDRLTFALSHRVVFISHSLLEAYEADKVRLGKKAMVPGAGSSNGVDTQRFAPVEPEARAALRESQHLAAGDFHIVLASRIAHDKGIARALALAGRLADMKQIVWTFVGRAEADDLVEAIHSHPGRVRHLDHTDRLEDVFRSADLHLMLSEREGFGNVAIEAAALGVPTFAFDVVGLRDSVSVPISGRLFAQNDLDALEQAVRQAAADPRAFRRGYAGARRWAIDNFEEGRVWRRYKRVFTGQEPL